MPARTIVALSTLIGLAVATGSFAGPLDPPAGPVTPTGKTLTEVEPRTALDAPAGQIITIDAPGSYYLTGDRDDLTSNGVRVLSGGVTLDLNGFALRGTGADNFFISEIGVFISQDAGQDHTGPIVIRDGSITNFADGGIVSRTTLVEVVVEGVAVEYGDEGGIVIPGDGRVSGCTVTTRPDPTGTTAGISVGFDGAVESGFDGIVRDCVVSGTPRVGIEVRAGSVSGCRVQRAGAQGYLFGSVVVTAEPIEVSNCLALQCAGGGFYARNRGTFVDCSALSSGSHGFRADRTGVFERCIAHSSAGNGFFGSENGVYRGCVARFSSEGGGDGSNGFRVGSASVLNDCVAAFNGGAGFRSDDGTAFTNCSSSGNATGFTTEENATLTGCSAKDNAGDGFLTDDGSVISACVSSSNAANGFVLLPNGTITDSTATLNGTTGFVINSGRISGCTASENGRDGISAGGTTTVDSNTAVANAGAGIQVAGNALAIKNAASGNSPDFRILPGANAGPVASNLATATSPFANVIY
ncbi:MAG: right-handed parallel beta-helix repeat-containing protein [Planctomycetota bacterium]